ncbi:hypothetical protein K488DRAFT_88504 [Vararia minispora EC-137]|uniref:Uncharacterized protein n=1 Tax=Vararia minispora EC-137 TaxID=1314806 RepID=A0ACB8QDG9_9AGAM|nr:hypothetical protein K488DRAFT_88504 [Vararia minispora EC-137]
MLPQVANHIFHHTTRAVAAAPAVRNVLGTSAPSPSWAGASSSYGAGAGAGGHAGAGGSKYHAGSRFYSGYTGPGRAVTQANTSTANGTEFDDEEMRPSLPSTRHKFRTRSQSFSLGSGAHGKKARAQSLGVLKAVQAHYRSRHAFAGPIRPLLPSSEEIERPATPRLVRRNSTASTVSVPPSPGLPPEVQSRAPSPLSLADPAAPQTVFPPIVRAAIDRLRAEDTKSVVSEWNLAIKALWDTRVPKDPVSEIVSVYHDMLARNLRPDMTTYACLLDVLLQRSFAVNVSVRNIHESIERRSLIKDRVAQSGQRDYMDHQTLAALQGETNYESALTIFRTVDRVSGWAFEPSLYTSLFQACAEQRDIEAALQVFAHMEHRHMQPQPADYAWLIRAYTDVGDFEGARVVFEEMERVRSAAPASSWSRESPRHVMHAWNEMIRAHILASNAPAGLALLERMMDSPRGVSFGRQDIPSPSAMTYDYIIDAFCGSGDYRTAVAWYSRLQKEGEPVASRHQPVPLLPKPRVASAEKIIIGLGKQGRVDEINEFGKHVNHTWFSAIALYLANIRHLLSLPSGANVVERLDALHAELNPVKMFPAALDFSSPADAFAPAIALYARSGQHERATDLLTGLLDYQYETRRLVQPRHEFWPTAMPAVSAVLFDSNGGWMEPPFLVFVALLRTRPARALGLPDDVMNMMVHAFDRELTNGTDLDFLGMDDWQALAHAVWSTRAKGERATRTIAAVLKGMAQGGPEPSSQALPLVQLLADLQGVAGTSELLRSLGPAYEALLFSPSGTATPELSTSDSILSTQECPSTADTSVSSATAAIDSRLSTMVSQLIRQSGGSSRKALDDAWRIFLSHTRKGVYPEPATMGLLIQNLGRAHRLDQMYEAYDAAQVALGTIDNSARRLRAWGTIEENMIVGLAHAGDGQRADVHRRRMLEHGLTPNADAYAALIQAVRDTTDDTTVAMTYFDEATARGVHPNLFLFNTAISKLAKARKAELALQLFNQMQALNIRRTPVTYGAVIGACCRVGDIATAETLFEEMLATQNRKKLRVPPFNTMMQFFVQTKPNRERVMQYYTTLLREGIMPAAHTYKLVLDAYGSIEPVDFASMERTFQTLCDDPNVAVEGVHWASLINAYGCVGKDLDKAVATFESITAHPTTPKTGAPASAVIYEALINVFVTHRRVDLIQPYLKQLHASGVHMTAYIANLLIRGHASTGDIAAARAVFEAMHDPPAGVAASNNHAPHDSLSAVANVSPDAPVYREPSTWEAMVRAELGQGNRDEALTLLERLAARHYPESIYKRIGGIMLDDSVSPWPAASTVIEPIT